MNFFDFVIYLLWKLQDSKVQCPTIRMTFVLKFCYTEMRTEYDFSLRLKGKIKHIIIEQWCICKIIIIIIIIIILFNQQGPPGACVLMCTKMIE